MDQTDTPDVGPPDEVAQDRSQSAPGRRDRRALLMGAVAGLGGVAAVMFAADPASAQTVGDSGDGQALLIGDENSSPDDTTSLSTSSGVNTFAANETSSGTSYYALGGFSTNGTGVYAESTNGVGLYGATMGADSAGVSAQDLSGGGGYGVWASSGAGTALYGQSSGSKPALAAYASGSDGIYGRTTSVGDAGVHGVDASSGPSSTGGYGVLGSSTNGTGVYGSTTNAAGFGVEALDASDGQGCAVIGSSTSGTGVQGQTTTGTGVVGIAVNGTAISGDATVGIGVVGSGSTYGVAGTGTGSGVGVQGTGATIGVQGGSAGHGVNGVTTGNGGVGVFGQDTSTDGGCGAQGETGVSSSGGTGVLGNDVSDNGAVGVRGSSIAGAAIVATSGPPATIIKPPSHTPFGLFASAVNGDGVVGITKQAGAAGVAGTDQSTHGFGVLGTSGHGVGVKAVSAAGVAIDVDGVAQFSRSGVTEIKGRASSPKTNVVLRNVAVTSKTLALATLQGPYVAGVGVASVLANPAKRELTIYLTAPVRKTVKVAWFLIN